MCSFEDLLHDLKVFYEKFPTLNFVSGKFCRNGTVIQRKLMALETLWYKFLRNERKMNEIVILTNSHYKYRKRHFPVLMRILTKSEKGTKSVQSVSLFFEIFTFNVNTFLHTIELILEIFFPLWSLCRRNIVLEIFNSK